MSRDISEALRAELISSHVNPALFIQMEFDSGNLNLWTGYDNKIWNGDTYIGAGAILGISEVEETGQLRAGSVSFSLSSLDASVISLALNSDYQGNAVNMWFAALSDTGGTLIEPYKLFEGVMDVISFDDAGDQANFQIRCETRAIDIRKAKERRYTDEDQKIDFPNDKGLEFISKIKDIDVVWG